MNRNQNQYQTMIQGLKDELESSNPLIGQIMVTTVTKACAWCGATLPGSYEDDEAPAGSVSHGICDDCAKKWRDKKDERQSPAHRHALLGRMLFAYGYGYTCMSNRWQQRGWVAAWDAAYSAACEAGPAGADIFVAATTTLIKGLKDCHEDEQAHPLKVILPSSESRLDFSRFTTNDIVPAEMRDDWVGV